MCCFQCGGWVTVLLSCVHVQAFVGGHRLHTFLANGVSERWACLTACNDAALTLTPNTAAVITAEGEGATKWMVSSHDEMFGGGVVVSVINNECLKWPLKGKLRWVWKQYHSASRSSLDVVFHISEFSFFCPPPCELVNVSSFLQGQWYLLEPDFYQLSV